MGIKIINMLSAMTERDCNRIYFDESIQWIPSFSTIDTDNN